MQNKFKSPSLRARLKKRVDDEDLYYISSYAVMFFDKKEEREITDFHSNDVCYARMSLLNNNYSVKEAAVSLGNHARILGKNRKLIKQYKEYAKYILTSSSWNLPFKTKTARGAFQYGIDIDVKQPLSRIIASLTALREGVEFNRKLPIFSMLLKKGYSGDVAYLISSIFVYERNAYVLSLPNSGHKILDFEMSLSGIIKFLKYGYRDLKERPYSKYNLGFKAQNSVCDKKNDLSKDVKEHLISQEKGQGWNVSESSTEKQVLDFADVLTQMMEKA